MYDGFTSKKIHLNWDAFEKMIALTPFKKYKPI